MQAGEALQAVQFTKFFQRDRRLHPCSLVLQHEKFVHGGNCLLIRIFHLEVLLTKELSIDIQEVQIVINWVFHIEAADLILEAQDIR
jgi:hypothetical protein